MKVLNVAILMGYLTILPLSQVTQAKITVVGMPMPVPMPISMESQTPSDESLQKLVKVMQIDSSLNQRLSQSKNIAIQAINQSLKDNAVLSKLSAEQSRQLEQLTIEYVEKIINEQNQPQMRQQLIQVYLEAARKTYTQQEVDAMITFYGSKIGQSIQSKQGDFAQISNEKIVPIVLNNQQKIMQRMLPDMQAKLKKILNQPQSKVNK